MKPLKPSQLKGLSEFLNTIAAAWFTAGVISQFFIKIEDTTRAITLGFFAVCSAGVFLWASISLLKGVKS